MVVVVAEPPGVIAPPAAAEAVAEVPAGLLAGVVGVRGGGGGRFPPLTEDPPLGGVPAATILARVADLTDQQLVASPLKTQVPQ